jgi:hypothetical protein
LVIEVRFLHVTLITNPVITQTIYGNQPEFLTIFFWNGHENNKIKFGDFKVVWFVVVLIKKQIQGIG